MVMQRAAKFNTDCIPSHQADAVGVEFCCSTCVFRIDRPHHFTTDTVTLAEGAGTHQV